jgi:hypothetical protein
MIVRIEPGRGAGVVKPYVFVAFVLGQVGVQHGGRPRADVGPVRGQANGARRR